MNTESNQESQLFVEIANQQELEFDEARLLQAAETILQDHGIVSGELSIAVVDDPTIRKLNKQYLEHDYETDVLSFAFESDLDAGFLNGQLIVSADTAARLANELSISTDDELLLYVVHGTLHLVGLKDKTDADASEMRKAESSYLARYGVEHRWAKDEDEPEGAN